MTSVFLDQVKETLIIGKSPSIATIIVDTNPEVYLVKGDFTTALGFVLVILVIFGQYS